MRNFVWGRLKNKRMITEGSSLYDEYRDTLLREAERSLLFGVSCLRRGLDLLVGTGSAWSLVTLYYANWFGARSILAMYGVWYEAPKLVEVEQDTAGRQRFRVRHDQTKQSHRAFWNNYYAGIRLQTQIIKPDFAAAVQPVSGNPGWQIELRNRVNYDTLQALRLSSDFEDMFDSKDFPKSLPREIGTQFNVAKATLLLSSEIAHELSIGTDAFKPRAPDLRTALERSVFGPPVPELSSFADEARFKM